MNQDSMIKEYAYNDFRSQRKLDPSSVAPKPVASQAILKELEALLGKARAIEIRQNNLKDRIFGDSPKCEESATKDVSPNGFLHEVTTRIQLLHCTLDRVIQNCVDLERLA